MKESGSHEATRSQEVFRPLRKHLWFSNKHFELPPAYSSPQEGFPWCPQGKASIDDGGGHLELPVSPGTEPLAGEHGKKSPSRLPSTSLPPCALQPYKQACGQTPGRPLPNHDTALAMKQVGAMFLKHPTPSLVQALEFERTEVESHPRHFLATGLLKL